MSKESKIANKSEQTNNSRVNLDSKCDCAESLKKFENSTKTSIYRKFLNGPSEPYKGDNQ